MSALGAQKRRNRIRRAKIRNEVVCSVCGSELDKLLVCKECKHHEKLSIPKRIEFFEEEGGKFEQLFEECDVDYSKVYGYDMKFTQDRKRTGLNESVIAGKCGINNCNFVAILMDYRFMAGTLAQANGEKIAKAFEYAIENNLPVVALCAGGGVRIQEGAFGLVQMAKTVATLTRLHEEGLPFISILTNPTYGGTTASFGLMGDINIAESGSFIGFGGKMLTKDILHEQVPADFQSANYVLRNGGVDMICERRDLLKRVLGLLDLLSKNNVCNLENKKPECDYGVKNPENILKNIRSGTKPVGVDYLFKLFDNPIILKGDRISYDDKSLLTGLGKIHNTKVAFIIQNKGRNLRENIEVNYGMTRPEGLRKAKRIAKLAEKFHLPILILLDSPGAHPGNIAEKNCQSIAISESMINLLKIKTPIITIVTSEGCSGGALALSISDAIAMFSGAIYSVISPEAYSSIIFNETHIQPELLAKMNFTAKDLYDKKLIDEILAEKTLDYNVLQIQKYVIWSLNVLSKLKVEQLLSRRYNRIRNWDKR